MARPNRCKKDRIRPEVDVDHHNGGVTRIRCPKCGQAEISNSLDHAVTWWNVMNPGSRWPWVVAAAILLLAFIGGAING